MLWIGVLFFMCGQIVEGMEKEDLLFYASYDGTTDAFWSRNLSKSANVIGTATYEPGIRGQALVCGEEGAICGYNTADNFFLESGTVEMWIKLIDWDGGDLSFHRFFETDRPGWFLLYQYIEGGIRFLTQPETSTRETFAWTSSETIKKDTWHHLAVTWQEKEIKIYLDGKFKDTKPAALPAQVGPRFWIGDRPWQGMERKGNRKTLIDEVYIYRRALSEDEIKQDFERTSSGPLTSTAYQPPLVTIFQTQSTPDIDGRMEVGEWDHAASVGWFLENRSGTLARRQSMVRMMYDQKNLYLAFISPVSENAVLMAKRNIRDSEVWEDDAVEVFLSPNGKDVYHFIGNSISTLFDKKNSDTKWNADCWYVSRVEKGIWIAEWSIPFSVLDTSVPREGEKWRVNFCRDLISPKEWTAWALRAFSGVSSFGTMVFRTDGPAMSIDRIGRLKAGKIACEGEIYNSASKPAQVEMNITAVSALSVDKQIKKIMVAEAGRSTILGMDAHLSRDVSNLIVFTMKDLADGQELYRLCIPAEIDPGIELKTRFYPSRGICETSIDLNNVSEIPEKFEINVALIASKDNEVLERRKVTSFDHLKGTTSFDLKKMSAGKYRLHGQLVDENGTVLSSRDIEFEKPDDSWIDNKIGVVDKTPPSPWTPITVCSDDREPIIVGCWGRELTFDRTGLIQQIKTAGQDILNRPVRLVAKQKSEPMNLSMESLKIDSSTAVAVELSSRGKLASANLHVKTRIEFDGMILFDIVIESDHPLTLDSLVLEIPLRAKNTKYRLLPEYYRENGGAINLDSQKPWTYPFINYLWVGDEDRGLTWFSESTENWVIPTGAKPISMLKDGETIDLAFKLIDGPVVLEKNRRFVFGLHPTPVKPMLRNHRAWGFERNIALIWANDRDEYFGYPQVKIPGSYDGEVKQARVSNMMTSHYLNLTMLAEASPEWKYYGLEWDDATTECSDSPDVVALGSPIRGVCPAADGVNDFFAWKIHEFVTKNGLDGVYSDFASPRICHGLIHGCNGRMPILAWREHYKRVYVMLKRFNKPTNFVQHVSWGVCSPVLSFADAYLDGEQHGSLNITDYLEKVPLDMWRTEFTGRQYGVIPLFIPGTLSDKSPLVIQAMMGLLLLHDIQGVWPNGYLTNREYVEKVLADLYRFGIGQADVEFIPYWNNQSIVKDTLPAIKTSIYRRSNQSAMVVLFNTSKKDVTARVKLQNPGLMIDSTGKKTSVVDLLTGESLGSYDGMLKVPIKARNCRLVVIKQ